MTDWGARRDALRSHGRDAKIGLAVGAGGSVLFGTLAAVFDESTFGILSGGAASVGTLFALGRLGMCPNGFVAFQALSILGMSAGLYLGLESEDFKSEILPSLSRLALANTIAYVAANQLFFKRLQEGGGPAFGNRNTAALRALLQILILRR